MSLQQVLDNMPVSFKLPFLRGVINSENEQSSDASDLLLNILETDLQMGRGDTPNSRNRIEYNSLIHNKIEVARQVGDQERVNDLIFRLVNSHHYNDSIQNAAIKSNNLVVIERTIDEFKSKDPWRNWDLVMNLMEHLGQSEEAKVYALNAIDKINERRTRGPKGSWKNHGVDNIYIHLGMYEEAVEIRLDNLDFIEAMNLAEEYLPKDKLPDIYQRSFDGVKGHGYHQGYPIQIIAAEKLGDERLLRRTKEDYINWLINTGKDGRLDLVKEVGTQKQLFNMHSRIVGYHVAELECNFINSERGMYHLDCLFECAQEAYQDTNDKKFASHAMDAAEKLCNFPKALEYAKIVGSDKVSIYEEAVQLMG